MMQASQLKLKRLHENMNMKYSGIAARGLFFMVDFKKHAAD
jgi:hypothetical protein